ncbi:hypothetical protein SKAU_G00264920 [Synaphobranchus kaupii]|uniref:Uncharacterized protein n=1 Tax=Synaphobranchus kaupii TaxID=118154 RepID=A0A9Q1EZ61_SYNKA|nr:hypothetical protein SKAU_G00264920 [Synaphobranchus kaupii]
MIAAKAKGPEAPVPLVIESIQRIDEALCLKMTNIMHTAYYVAKKELPFTQFRTLHGLINRTGGKLPDCYESDKACARFIVDIYEMEREKLLNKIKQASYDIKHGNAGGILDAIHAAFEEAGISHWKDWVLAAMGQL